MYFFLALMVVVTFFASASSAVKIMDRIGFFYFVNYTTLSKIIKNYFKQIKLIGSLFEKLGIFEFIKQKTKSIDQLIKNLSQD